jgi:hypothetical protein
MPMADVLWGFGFARGGFKLISSVSAQRGLPRTAAETFSVKNDANGYRRMIELFVRGFNYFVMGAREPSAPRGTGAEFTGWAGRSSYLLQGGRQVADIAVLFPIESLQAFYAFNDPRNSAKLPAGAHAYAEADYQAVGEMLLSDLRRDFTFVHPDALSGDQFSAAKGRLTLTGPGDGQSFRVLVIPGGEVISVGALAKAKAFYDAGGAVIGTSLLPSRSAEFGKDEQVRALVADIFGPVDQRLAGTAHRAAGGGRAVFISRPSPAALAQALADLGAEPDVTFLGEQPRPAGPGTYAYTHRQRDGKDIYYFGNSGDAAIGTKVSLRGQWKQVELWNPHTGAISRPANLRQRNGRTEFDLLVPALSSLAAIGRR